MSPRNRLILSLCVVLGVYVTGAIGYYVLEGCSWFDAFYMTTITLSTVGYREAFEMGRPGQVWTIVVITLGLGGVSFAFTSLVSLAVGGDIREMIGRRRYLTMLEQMKGHVILCGHGRMGSLAAQLLQQHHIRLVVVESDAEICRRLAEDGVLHVEGDAMEDDTLLRAGLMNSKALVACLSNDADNVYITLTAHGLRPDLHIIARAEQPSTESKLRRAGAARVICPQIVGADKIANMLARPHVTDFFDVAAEGIDLEMDEFVVKSGSPLCNTKLRDGSVWEKARATVVAIKRADGEAVYQPTPDEVIQAGDVLIMIGRAGLSKQLRNLEERK